MAETYKGLTIQIGADTSQLAKDLKSVEGGLSRTQKMVSALNKALRFDPDNLDATAVKVRVLANRTGELAIKARDLKADMAQVSPEVKALKESIKDSSIAMAEADKQYAKVTAALAAQCDKIREASSNVEQYRAFWEKVAADNGVEVEAKSIKELYNELLKLGYVEKALSGDVLSFGDVVKQMRSLGIKLGDLGVKYDELAARHREWNAEVNKIKAVRVYEQAEVELQKTESEMRAVVREATEAHMKMQLMGTDMKAFDQATNMALDRLRALKEISSGASGDGSIAKLNSYLKQANATADLLDKKMAAIGKDIEKLEAVASRGKDNKMAMGLLELAEKAQQAEDELRDVEKEMARVSSEAAMMRARMGNIDGKNSGGLLTSGSKEDLENLALTREELRLIEAEEAEVAKRLETARNAALEFRAAIKAHDLKTTFKSIEASVAKVRAEFNATTGSANNFMNSIRTAGYAMYSTIAPAVTMMAYKTIQATSEIDSAYRDMRKTLQATEAEYEALYDSAVKYSLTHVTSAAGMLEIESLLAQVGVTKDAIEATATVISNLETATSLDAESLSTQLGQLITTMKLGEGGAEQFGNSLVRLGNNMATNETQIMDVISYMGSAATQYGFSADQALAWAAAMASSGQGAEAAGSAFTRVMAMIESAANKGGDKLDAFARVAGMSANEFADAWSKGPSEAMYALVKGLADVAEEGGSVELALQSLGIVNVRDKQLLRGLTQEVYDAADGQGVLRDALIMSKDAWDGVTDAWGEAGDAANEAEKKTEGFSGTVEKISHNLDALFLALGEGSVPLLNGFLGAIQGITAAISGMPAPVLTGVEAVGGLVAAIGPLAIVVGSVGAVMGTFQEKVIEIGTSQSIKKAGKAVGELGGKVAESAASWNKFDMTISALKGMAALAAIGMVVASVSSALMEMHDNVERVKSLSYSASDAMEDAAAAYKSAAVDVDEYSSSLGAVVKSSEDAVAAISQSNIELTSSLVKVQNAYDQMGDAISTIDALRGEEVFAGTDDWDSLAASVDTLNAYLDTNYTLVHDFMLGTWRVMDGEVEVLTEDLLAAADAFRMDGIRDAVQGNFQQYRSELNSVNASNDALREKIKQLTGASDEYIDTMLGIYNVIGFAPVTGFGWTDEAVEALHQLAEGGAAAETAAENYELAKRMQDELAESARGAIEATGQFGDTSAMSSEDVLKLAESISSAVTGLEKMAEKDSSLVGYLADAGYSLDSYAAHLVSVGADMDTFASAYESHLGQIRNGASVIKSAFDEAGELSVDGFLDNIRQNNDIMTEWNAMCSEMIAAANQSWNDADRDFVEWLVSLGPEYMDVLQRAWTDPEFYAQLQSEYAESVANALTAAENEVAGTEKADTEIKVSADVEFDSEAIMARVTEMSTNVVQAFGTMGEESTAGFNSGVINTSEAVATAMGNFAEHSVKDPVAKTLDINSPSKVMEEYGGFVTEGFAQGVDLGAPAVATAMTQMADGALLALDPYREQFKTAGYYMSAGLAEGISQGASLAISAAANVASQALQQAKTTLNERSPSKATYEMGQYFSQGFAMGIDADAYRASATASEMAVSALRAANSAGKPDWSAMPAGVGGVVNNNYSIEGIDFTGDSDVEQAMMTIFGKMRVLGRM